ncbi:serine/threonine protein kinase [Polytolypa hystricis UAMH7299]|uniref:Serine/threonine protein kinase n=1 Tax=Polytolypa hystricis (strain UAMH7299) TaxID=1447883 RepID=A0A2B7XI73_POLH7|nr:serine/threonine protein kinase [Polytolypa hystricis UAMH7299]
MQQQSDDFLETYRVKLEGWEQNVACQPHSKRAECTCKRYFVPMDRVEKWLEEQQSQGDANNLDGLLRQLEDKMKTQGVSRQFASSKTILEDDNRCVTVFAVLLELGRGELIYLFQSMNVVDKILDWPPALSTIELAEELKRRGITDGPTLLDDFDEAKWAYCSPPLRLDMERNMLSPIVLPFCRCEPVNDKGGTASVFQVAVQEELILDPKLADALSKSLYDDRDFGKVCYQMAVKSFTEDTKDIYEWEKTAFAGLQNDGNVPIVRYLGSFYRNDGSGERDSATYNLLLEFGQVDLDEFWADIANIPPVRTEEIINSWDSLFNIAKAIDRVHKVNNKGKVYDGWHADVKPDNILLVHDKFKLADFGFARLVERAKDKEAPEQYIEGGTQTYGAPELARMKNGTRTPVQQTIDTWSLGCVFSVAATWNVLGFRGVQQYERLRKLASRSEAGTVTDKFHNNVQVLPEVLHWHDHLRNHIRAADTLTRKVLDFIEINRLKSGALCDELGRLLEEAWDSRKRLVEKGTLRPIHGSVKQALQEAEASSYALIYPQPSSAVQKRILLRSELGQSPLPAHVSKRLSKSAGLSVRIGRAPYQEKLLQTELRDNTAVLNGELTESPVNYKSPVTFPMETLLQSTKTIPNRSENGDTARPDSRHTSKRHSGSERGLSSASSNFTAPITPNTPTSTSARTINPSSDEIEEPKHVFDLPWNVCKVRKDLEDEQPVTFTRYFKGEKKDKYLENQMINGRDLVLVIDNGTTVRKYWNIVMFVAETLAMKIAGLDDDGYDLVFTMGHKYNRDRLKGKAGLKDVRKLLSDAYP